MPSVEEEIRACTYPAGSVRIKCLGVFDTVGAMGVPLSVFWRENRDLFEFHDVSLSAITDVNLHALAVDEHRQAFQPTVWRQQKFSAVATATEQVWFTGSHGDIGGGYVNEDERKAFPEPALDDITLDWMIRRVLCYYPNFPVNIGKKPAWPQIAPEWAQAPQHESRRSFYRALPFALRSVCNNAVPTWPGRFETNVCYDRHASPIGEMVHRSAIERIGRRVRMDRFRRVYAPRNLLVALGTVGNGAKIRIVDWSGATLGAAEALDLISAAKGRLRDSSSSITFLRGGLP
jgi:hypothetical protein